MRRLERSFPAELEKLKATLTDQRKQIDPADLASVAEISARIDAVDVELTGGKAPARRKAPAAAAAPAAPKAPESKLKSLGSAMRAAVAEARR